jgi:hypothetical protein
VLEIDGNPGGAVYLDKGHITFARASWSPNLIARLRAVLPPVADVRGMLAAGDRPDRDLGAWLVTRGYLTGDQLHAILRSIVIDAVMVLTVLLAEEASIARMRFEPAKTHWAQSMCRLPVHLVRTEAAGRAERMKRLSRSSPARQSAANAAMPSRLPGAAVAGPGREPPGDSATVRPAWAGDGALAPLPPESLIRVLDGLRKLS